MGKKDDKEVINCSGVCGACVPEERVCLNDCIDDDEYRKELLAKPNGKHLLKQYDFQMGQITPELIAEGLPKQIQVIVAEFLLVKEEGMVEITEELVTDLVASCVGVDISEEYGEKGYELFTLKISVAIVILARKIFSAVESGCPAFDCETCFLSAVCPQENIPTNLSRIDC